MLTREDILENWTWKKIDAGLEIQLCLPLLVMDASAESGAGGCGGGVWYRTGPMSGPPLGETTGAIGRHGVHRQLSKTFRHFFKRFDKRWGRYN